MENIPEPPQVALSKARVIGSEFRTTENYTKFELCFAISKRYAMVFQQIPLVKKTAVKEILSLLKRNKPMIRTILGMNCLVLFVFLPTSGIHAQDPLRFEAEVNQLKLKNDSLWNSALPTQVFTGSSSIRMWEDLQARFPEKHIVNSGFGGSQASDLLYYLELLVLDYSPEKVFIYEGDNDLAEGKKPKEILHTLREISGFIQNQHPGLPIVFISAKPSISRWKQRKKYRRFNRKLEKWTRQDASLFFVDVWKPMLEGSRLDKTLFVEDGLHLNSKGYDIWEKILHPHIAIEPY
jgi:lysophospholipase L1-like esterase